MLVSQGRGSLGEEQPEVNVRGPLGWGLGSKLTTLFLFLLRKLLMSFGKDGLNKNDYGDDTWNSNSAVKYEDKRPKKRCPNKI